MSLAMKKIVVTKSGENTGTASVKLEDESGAGLVLNKIQIDLNAADAPVQVLKHEGTQLYAGDIITQVVGMVFDVFTEQLSANDPGIYEVTQDGVKQIK